MNGSSIDTVVPETKAPLAKQEKSARPLISRLYDGTAELVIRLPGPSSKTLDTIDFPETVELSLPSPGKHADNNDRIVSLVSMLTSYLLKDIESTKSHNLKEAQAEGRLRAKREGKQIGRPKKEFPDAYYEAIDLCREGKISIAEAAERSGMTYWAFYANMRRNNHAETES